MAITQSRLVADSSTAVSSESSDGEFDQFVEHVIRPRSGWIAIDWRELIAYRDLLFF